MTRPDFIKILEAAEAGTTIEVRRWNVAPWQAIPTPSAHQLATYVANGHELRIGQPKPRKWVIAIAENGARILYDSDEHIPNLHVITELIRVTEDK